MADVNGINQRIREFHEQNGGSDNCVVSGDWILYANGAVRERNPYGALIDPPSDPRQRAENIARFWKCKLALAVQMFDEYKFQHLGHAKLAVQQAVVPDILDATPEVVNQLKAFQKKARDCKKKLQTAEQELEALKPARLRQLEEMSRRNRETAQNMIQQLSEIEI